jgi:CPA1 family monovalent cation:H+ antiporter
VVDFLLQGFVFLVIGQELPTVLKGLGAFGWSTILWATLCTVGVVLVTRPLWLTTIGRIPLPRPWPGRAVLGLLSPPIDCPADDPDAPRRLNWRETTVLSWAGTRGVITLAAAFAIPAVVNGAPFPDRPLIVFCAYVVVLFTLLAQGLTFAPVVKWAGLRVSAEDELETLARARAAAVDAGIRRLDELEADGAAPPDISEWLRTGAELRRRQSLDQLEALHAEEGAEPAAEIESDVQAQVRVEMIAAEREELIAWRDGGRLPDKGFRVLLRQLDREEGDLPPE